MGEKKKKGGAHKALYRKYRSKSLDEIVGQEHITKTLQNAIKSGKISHAYLFTGPRGVGKTSIARILAHEVNGIPYTDDSMHLDIIEIDAASNRRIDDIRDLREKVNLAPVQAKYKVYIIDEVHMLTQESFNALLKTLEEPPEHVIFILATTEANKLPATIVSRTQRHTFRAVPKEKVVEHLSTIAKNEAIEIDAAALELLAEHGEGSFRDSISLLDQISHLPQPVSRKVVEDLLGIAPQDEIQQLLDYARSGNTEKLIATTRHLNERGISPSASANQLLSILSSQTPSPQTIALMKELLQVSSSQQKSLALEITLIQFALKNTLSATEKPEARAAAVALPTKTEAKPTTVKENREPPSTKKEAPEEKPVEAAKTELKEPVKSGAKQGELEEFWPDILKEIKERNGSLYTVMRLAQPNLSGETLTLTFQFPFHKKRLEDVKHISLISEIVSNHIDLQPVIEAIVDPSLKQEPTEEFAQRTELGAAPSPDPAHASLITSVQDIMGGGEVIDANNI